MSEKKTVVIKPKKGGTFIIGGKDNKPAVEQDKEQEVSTDVGKK